MIFKDPIYEKEEINDKVLVELIESKPIQRLKGVMQGGILYKVKPWKTMTRYDHSVGVMLLLRSRGASIEEQIAGLLHDISHTAFSHAIDFVYKNEKHDFHEKFHEKIITESEIPKILDKYGFDLDKILEEKNFPLLEKISPNLCADRVDYTLREIYGRDKDQKKVNNYFSSVVNVNNELVFNEENVALSFSKDFLEMVQNWATPLELAVVETLADAIRLSLNKGIINEEDLFSTDNEVLNKMKKDVEVNNILNKINPKMKVIEDEKNYDFYSKEKLRFIDPKVYPSMKRVSEVFPEYKKLLEEHKEILSKGIYAKII